jgi:hypothetical protein
MLATGAPTGRLQAALGHGWRHRAHLPLTASAPGVPALPAWLLQLRRREPLRTADPHHITGGREGKIKALSRDARQVIVCTSVFREAGFGPGRRTPSAALVRTRDPVVSQTEACSSNGMLPSLTDR